MIRSKQDMLCRTRGPTAIPLLLTSAVAMITVVVVTPTATAVPLSVQEHLTPATSSSRSASTERGTSNISSCPPDPWRSLLLTALNLTDPRLSSVRSALASNNTEAACSALTLYVDILKLLSAVVFHLLSLVANRSEYVSLHAVFYSLSLVFIYRVGV